MSTPITTTRDLLRYRKFTSPIILTLSTYYLSLLASPSPSSVLLRAAFFPAILNSATRPRDALILKETDEKLRKLLEDPPELCIIQGSISNEMILNAWKSTTPPDNTGEGAGGGSGMENRIFLSHALHSELTIASDEGEKEIVANLSVMVLATITFELAEWIYVKTHGYTPMNLSRNNSIYTMSSSASLHSSYQEGTNSGSGISVGTMAVHSTFGYDYSLLAYTIGERQLVKRLPSLPSVRRKPPTLTPPLLYSLIGDTPSILDVTNYPVTQLRTTPQWKESEMFAIVSVLEPRGGGKGWRGVCEIGGEGEGEGSERGSVIF